MRMRDARHPIGVIAGASWLGAAMALALLWSGTAFAAQPKVVLLRGWFGVFSTGLDSLADELKAKGVHAQVAGHLSWKTVVSDILRERAAGKTGPLVLMGHSQGANNVIDMARALAAHNVRVDLLVTLVPLMQNPVPANVMRAINYYQSPGIWGSPLAVDFWLPRQARQYRRSRRPHHFAHQHRQERQDPFGYFARDIGTVPGEVDGGKRDRLPQPAGRGRGAAFGRKEPAGARGTGGETRDPVDQCRGVNAPVHDSNWTGAQHRPHFLPRH